MKKHHVIVIVLFFGISLIFHIIVSYFFSPKISSEAIRYFFPILAFILYLVYRRYKPKLIQEAVSSENKILENEKVSFITDNDGYFVLWKSDQPIELKFRLDRDHRMKIYKAYKYAISPKGYRKLFCLDESNNLEIIDEYDIDTQITFQGKRYEFFSNLLEEALNVDIFQLNEISEKYCNYLYQIISERKAEERKRYQEREESLKVIYSFPETEIKLSVFGDYFDESAPHNHLPLTFICTGLFGYPDTKEITGLYGTTTIHNKDVVIRLNAIRTKITLNKKKYTVNEFLDLAKNFE